MSAEQSQQFINLVVTLVIGVLALGGGGLVTAVMVIRQHKDLVTMVYHSIPIKAQQSISEALKEVNDVVDLAQEVTGQPPIPPVQ